MKEITKNEKLLTRLNKLLAKHKALKTEIALTEAKMQCTQLETAKRANKLPTPRVSIK